MGILNIFSGELTLLFVMPFAVQFVTVQLSANCAITFKPYISSRPSLQIVWTTVMCRQMRVMDESVLSFCGPDCIHTSIFSCQVAMLDWMACHLWHSAPFCLFMPSLFSSLSILLKALQRIIYVQHVCIKKYYTINTPKCFIVGKS